MPLLQRLDKIHDGIVYTGNSVVFSFLIETLTFCVMRVILKNTADCEACEGTWISLTEAPTRAPTNAPTHLPTSVPTNAPTTATPTALVSLFYLE